MTYRARRVTQSGQPATRADLEARRERHVRVIEAPAPPPEEPFFDDTELAIRDLEGGPILDDPGDPPVAPEDRPHPSAHSAISDKTWAALEEWLRTRDRYDLANPYNWVAVPWRFGTWRHIRLRDWERLHRDDSLRRVLAPPPQIAPDELEIEPDPFAPAGD